RVAPSFANSSAQAGPMYWLTLVMRTTFPVSRMAPPLWYGGRRTSAIAALGGPPPGGPRPGEEPGRPGRGPSWAAGGRPDPAGARARPAGWGRPPGAAASPRRRRSADRVEEAAEQRPEELARAVVAADLVRLGRRQERLAHDDRAPAGGELAAGRVHVPEDDRRRRHE